MQVLELAGEASLLADWLRHKNIAAIFSVTILKYACVDKACTMDSVGQILSRQDRDGCYTKEKKKAYETMKPKRASKEEILRLMEEKNQLKEDIWSQGLRRKELHIAQRQTPWKELLQ
ncbi:uncharacterized protein LOC105168707 isoform X2 [Sesamum indicum]|uniref:Uncharacterized protein LOC105168707 isoform X2 n=1 Tax=Sesamum indicum TaxID=4182 RepID=A0A6I9TTZ3_SESIN|nr:uncharacterized protein LOC105168707 isoform X2 [Sesamum indicum]